MKLKQAILTIMDRDTLKAVVDDLEIEGVDRRSVKEMRAKVSHSQRAVPEMLLAHLSENQVKAVCEEMNVSPSGRRKELMDRLLNTTGAGGADTGKAVAAACGKELRRAILNGVEILVYDVFINLQGIRINRELPHKL